MSADDVVLFELVGTLGRVAIDPYSGDLAEIEIAVATRDVIKGLRNTGARVGLVTAVAVTPSSLTEALARVGLDALFDPEFVEADALTAGAAPARLTSALTTGDLGQQVVLVSDDSHLRQHAIDRGWSTCPHPRLAEPVLSGEPLVFMQATAGAGLSPGDTRKTLRQATVVPLAPAPGIGSIYAVGPDRAVATLGAAGFQVQRLGAQGSPTHSDLYLFRNDKSPGLGAFDGSNDAFALLDPAVTSSEVDLVQAVDQQVIATVSSRRSVESLHFGGALHGHTMKLTGSVDLWTSDVEMASFAADETSAAAPITEPEVLGALARIDGATVQADLDRYSGVAPVDSTGTLIASRHIDHPDNREAVDALARELRVLSSDLTVRLVPFTHQGQVLHNVEAELGGTTADLVLVTAHLDSTAAFSPPYDADTDPAPGVDDDGSGLVSVLAAARTAVELAPTFSTSAKFRFVFFNAEEHGLVGSRAYAATMGSTGARIRAVFQMDMMGYNVRPPRSFELHVGFGPNRDTQTRSQALATRLAGLRAGISPGLQDPQVYLSTTSSSDPAEGRSDHTPFHQQGYAACLASEDFFAGPDPSSPAPEGNPNYHRSTDTIVDADYCADIARLVTAAAWQIANPTRITTPVPGDQNMGVKIGSGATPVGTTAWQPYSSNTGIYVDVDTSACGFATTPTYVTSIGGSSSHWATTGATSVYTPTPTGFRIYLRWAMGGSLTPDQANASRWHINWVAVGG